MTLKEMMSCQNFVVVGNTLVEEKYAYKIKMALIKNKYEVLCVGYELKSINEVTFDDFILDLCIHPVKGLELLKENKKIVRNVIIQPGAESAEIISFLQDNNINYILGCVLVGLKLVNKDI